MQCNFEVEPLGHWTNSLIKSCLVTIFLQAEVESTAENRFTVHAWWDKFPVYFRAVFSIWNDYGLKGMTVTVLNISSNNMWHWCAFTWSWKKSRVDIQRNTDLMKWQWTGEICSLYWGFVTSMIVMSRYTWLIFNAQRLWIWTNTSNIL